MANSDFKVTIADILKAEKKANDELGISSDDEWVIEERAKANEELWKKLNDNGQL